MRASWHERCKRLAPLMRTLLPWPLKHRDIAGRSAVRLALRMAQPGQRVVLVEMPAGYRVVPIERARTGGPLRLFASLAGGALILARPRA